MRDPQATSMTLSRVEQLWSETTRREFFRLAAIGGTAVLLPSMLAGCRNDGGDGITDPPADPAAALTLDLSSDAGVLNYAYALEQLEAAYYTLVVQRLAGAGLSAAEQAVLTDIRNHEVIHREFLALALGTAKIPDLALDFSSVNFGNRFSVLDTAKKLEDIGVAAYNGAGKLLRDASNLLVAGKIVSVEARHAAAIRDMLKPGSVDFAGDDVVDLRSGLEQVFDPPLVVAGSGQFIKTPIVVRS